MGNKPVIYCKHLIYVCFVKQPMQNANSGQNSFLPECGLVCYTVLYIMQRFSLWSLQLILVAGILDFLIHCQETFHSFKMFYVCQCKHPDTFCFCNLVDTSFSIALPSILEYYWTPGLRWFRKNLNFIADGLQAVICHLQQNVLKSFTLHRHRRKYKTTEFNQKFGR